MAMEIGSTKADYVGYEYREISVPREHVSLCLDSYPCFGWEVDPNHAQAGRRNNSALPAVPGPKDTVTLYFRRVRSISNKAELTRLQRNFDGCIAELGALEQSKTTLGMVASLTVGLLGTAFIAGSTFSVVSTPPMIWLTILLAIPGFLGWIVPYFLYRAIVRRKTAQIEPLMEQKYDEINNICQKGCRLLH